MSGQFEALKNPPVSSRTAFASELAGSLSLQRRSARTASAGSAVAPPIVHEVLNAPGQPLDAATRGFMEPRFGRTFGSVRIHAGDRAAKSAEAVGASAYTVGRQVVFAKDRYQPGSAEGRHLLAHELAHVVQQAGAAENSPDQISLGEPGTTAERQAEQTARTVSVSAPGLSQPSLGASEMSLQRQEKQAGVPESCPAREPDSNQVAAIIQKALSRGRSAPYSAEELQLAWYNVRQQREQSDGANCCSAELAAAEHYLYARFAVTHRDHSPFEMKAMIWGYGYLKFLVPRTGICPKSPDTQGSRDWGYKGADDAANIDLFHENLS